MHWNGGYVSDMEYATEFCAKQSPVHLSFACIINGFEPVPLDKPFTYFELGFGQGLTVNLMAASNPHGRFYAADFNPAQVVAAQELAQSAGLDNLTLLENSFAELAEGKVDLPQFDFITMHGVYTWITAENRRHIVDFIARYLKPGGIVYTGYNAMPGWAATLPLQRLLLEYGSLHPGTSCDQFVRARDFVQQLADGDAAYFRANPRVCSKWDVIKAGDPHYLVHEYMNRGGEPLYFADVAQEFAAAKLDFVGSADLVLAFPERYFTSEQQALLESVPDAVLRETVKDYLRNTGFRKDVFVRGARRMSPARQAQWLEQIGLALTIARNKVTLELDLGIGTLEVPEELYGPVADALAERPHTLKELASLPTLQHESMAAIGEIAALLTGSGQAAPFFVSYRDADTEPARGMSKAVAQRFRFDDNFRQLASPLLGTGVYTTLGQRLVYRALTSGVDASQVDAVTAQVRQMMIEEGHPIKGADNTPLDSEEAQRTALATLVNSVLTTRMPVWRQLKLL